MIPKVLVLMATYNGAPWLRAQLDSVLSQEEVDVRVLVSDDRSSDGSLALLSEVAARDPRVTLLPAQTAAGSAGANFLRLVAAADVGLASHVAFCDQDDIWSPDKLASACRLLQHANADLASSAVTARWPSGRELVLRQSSRETAVDHLFEGAGQGCTFTLSVRLFSRLQNFTRLHAEALATVHYHDWFVYAMTRSWCMKWAYDPTPHMMYRQHANNDTGARGGFAGVNKRLSLIRSGWYGRQVDAMILVCLLAAPEAAPVLRVSTLKAEARKAIRHRLRWACAMLVSSRRRLQDRMMLAVSALAGWL